MGDNDTEDLQNDIGAGAVEESATQDRDGTSYGAYNFDDEDFVHGTDSGALDTGEGFEDDAAGGMSSYGNEELYDIDESPEPDKNNPANFRDDSADFNEFGSSGSEYNQQFGNGSNDVIGGYGADDEEDAIYQRDLADARALASGATQTEDNFTDDYDEPEQDDFDGEYEDEVEHRNPNKVVAKWDTVDANGNVIKSEKFKEKDYEGWFTWHPGDEITVDKLKVVWIECRGFEQLKPIMDQLNNAVISALDNLSHGPNIILKLNAYIDKLGGDSKGDFLGSILKLVSSLPKSLIVIFIATIKAMFSQEWMEVFVITTLPKLMKEIIRISGVQKLLNQLFTLAVPLINRKHRIDN